MARKLILSRSVTWGPWTRGVYLASDDVVRLEGDRGRLIRAMRLLEGGASQEHVASMLGAGAPELLTLLRRQGMLVEHHENPLAGGRLEHQIDFLASIGLDAGLAQARLAAARVAIVGLGGIGSVVFQHLLAAGVADFVLIDHDVVSTPNLNRQFIYGRKDIGRPKVEAARRYARSIDSGIRVTAIRRYVRAASALTSIPKLRGSRLMVLAADRPPCVIERAASAACGRLGLAFLGGGCRRLSFEWGPLLPPELCGPYSRYLSKPPEVRFPRALAGIGSARRISSVSFGPINTLAGAHMAHDAIMYLCGGSPRSLGATIEFDARTMSFIREPLRL